MIIEGNGKDLIQETNLDVRIAIWKFMYINIQQFIRYTSIRVWTVYIMGGGGGERLKKKTQSTILPRAHKKYRNIFNITKWKA